MTDHPLIAWWTLAPPFLVFLRVRCPNCKFVSHPLDKLRSHRDLCSVWGPHEQASFDSLKAPLASFAFLISLNHSTLLPMPPVEG
jgi:hypothetical protein